MSRNFLNQSTGTDYIQGTATLFSYPFTINAWVYPTTVVGANHYVTLHNVVDNQRYSIGLNGTSTKAIFQCFDTTLATATSVTTNYTLNAWNMVTGVGTSATSRTIYLNGANSATNTTSKTPTTPTRWLIGASYGGGAVSPTAEGRIAEVAIWNVALTTAEITSLNTGVKAKYIRPQNLKVYVPIVRDVYDEREATSSASTTGTTVADHSRRYG